MSQSVERTSLDLRFQSYRLRNDAAEARFDFEDLTQFEDIEGQDDSVTAEPAAIKAAYLAEVQAFLERYRTECQKRRVDFVPVDTSMSFDKALMAYLQRRCGR